MPTPGICQRQLPIPALHSCSLDTIVDMGVPGSDIYKALFDLSQSIAGHSDLGTLCNSLAGGLRRVVSFDFLALVLHDPVHDQLRLHAVSGTGHTKIRRSSFVQTASISARRSGASRSHWYYHHSKKKMPDRAT